MKKYIDVIRRFFVSFNILKSLLVIILSSIAGYLIVWFLIYLEVMPKYDQLDPLVKDIISIPYIWLDLFLGACVPMFYYMAFHFFNIGLTKEVKQVVKMALPFIPYFKLFAKKPFLFLIVTSGLFFGSIFYLGHKGDCAYFIGLIIPLSILCFTVLLYNSYSAITSEEMASSFTVKYHKKTGHICIGIATILYIYVAFISPVRGYLALIKHLLK